MKNQTATKTRLITNTSLIIGAAVLAGVSLSAFMIAALLNQTTCTGTPGDLSKNGSLGPDDIAIMKEIIAGTKPFDACGDMGGDGVIGPGDIADLQNLISGQSTTPAIPATSPMTAPLKSYTSFQTFNKNYTSDTQIRLSTKGPIYSFVIDADVNLPNAWSLVRLTLTDTKGGEFLVYEGYPLISGLGKITVNKICDETCILNYITPQYLNIQIEDGSIYLKSAYAALQQNDVNDQVWQSGIDAYAKKIKLETDRLKITKINNTIQTTKDSDMRWTAGETLVSNLFYAEKKQLFSDSQNLPNLQGFEYYKGGVFEVASPTMPEDTVEEKAAQVEADIIKNPSKAPNAKLISSDNLTEDMLNTLSPNTYIIRPSRWDWTRNNGENWVTRVKDQEWCGSCWIFATVAAVESKINLWYNQHIDADISEQHVMCQLYPESSILHDDACDGGAPNRALNRFIFSGVTSEACFPYQGRNYDCNKKICTSGQWTFAGYKSIDPDRKNVKNALLVAGPLAFGIKGWSHEVLLVGYRDIYNDSGTLLKAVTWKFKNSWGVYGWGTDDGYGEMVVKKSKRDEIYSIGQPYLKDNPNKYKVDCVDKDQDNYCYWGISTPYKPASCPANCLNTWDRNDCDDTIGPKAGNQDCRKVFTCQPKPEPNTMWNFGSSYVQKGSDVFGWYPLDDYVTDYNIDPASDQNSNPCQFRCSVGYWNGSACLPTNCNGSTYPNADICPGDFDDAPLYTYTKLVSACTAEKKCEFVCNYGYILEKGVCVKHECIGYPPPDAEICPEDDAYLPADTLQKIVPSCTDESKCEYVCKLNCDFVEHPEDPSLNSCFCHDCVGSGINPMPIHSMLCEGDDYGLTEDTEKVFVGFCTMGTKCEYICEPGYFKNDKTGTCDPLPLGR